MDQMHLDSLAKKIQDVHGCSFADLKDKNQKLGITVDPLNEDSLNLVRSDKFFAAKLLDHTILSPGASCAQVMKVCEEASSYGFYSACVSSYNLPVAEKRLSGSDVKAISVVGFPIGNILTSVKVNETGAVIRAGAKEVDMVINVAALQAETYHKVFDDISSVVGVARDLPVKVILETSLLNSDQIVLGCLLSVKAGAAFVKSSTGFFGAPSLDDVRLMSQVVGGVMGVKASGGIRDWENFNDFLKAGATRVGASASCQIIQEHFNE